MSGAALPPFDRRRCARLLAAALIVAALLWPETALARGPLAGLGGRGETTRNILQLVVGLTVLSLAPGLLMTITSFTRIVVALSLLRTGIGTPGVPPNPVIISLALFLSFFVMQPTFEKAWADGVAPYADGRISEQVAMERAAAPLRQFMLGQVREGDLRLFVDLSRKPAPERAAMPMTVLVPAFMISELRRAFEIGFLLLLPFLVIDLAVSAVLMAMGMMMLPPTSIALPMKIVFFVLVDGWALVAGSLVKSFGTG